MTEVELLTQQIDSIRIVIDEAKALSMIWFVAMIISLFTGLTILMIGFDKKHIELKFLGIAFLFASIICLVGTFTSYNQVDLEQLIELKEQRNIQVRTDIKSFNCEELRLDILSKMEDESIEEWFKSNLNFEQEYYYHKCEIPLLEEVKKLGDEKLG